MANDNSIDRLDPTELRDQFYEFLSGRSSTDNALHCAAEFVTMHTDDHTDVHTDHGGS